MNIRAIEPRDRARLVEMGQRFFESSCYRALLGPADLEGFGRMVDGVLGMGAAARCLVAVDEHDRPFGMIGAGATLHPWNGAVIVEELIWWVDPEARGARLAGPKLLEQIESWGREIGARVVKMVAPVDNPAASRFYVKTGYRPIESAFCKVLE